MRFLDDGRIEMDNNTVERAIRPLCLCRKNALFASGDDGGARWAAVASLVETCKLNGVDPQRYLADLLTRLVDGWPQSRLDELMPWRWAAPPRADRQTPNTTGIKAALTLHGFAGCFGASGRLHAGLLHHLAEAGGLRGHEGGEVGGGTRARGPG